MFPGALRRLAMLEALPLSTDGSHSCERAHENVFQSRIIVKSCEVVKGLSYGSSSPQGLALPFFVVFVCCFSMNSIRAFVGS